MAKVGKWDLTSMHSLEAFAEYVRTSADALIVVIVRPGDAVMAVDELIDVMDVKDRLWEKDVPALLGSLRRSRDEARGKQLRKEAKR